MANPFIDHPRTVGESYLEHMGSALSFARTMFAASIACAVHAFLPFLFVKTGSSAITRLHDRMVTNRSKLARLDQAEQGAQAAE